MNSFHRVGLFLVLVSASLAPLRASTLAGGFGPLALVEGAAPVPGGCGRVTNECSCAGDMGGMAVTPSGGSLDATLATFTVTALGTSAYVINGVNNAVLTLTRGQTYTFDIQSGAAHPFFIKTVQGAGTGNAYNNGVTNNGTTSGTITFTVPFDAPDTLFYDCANHSPMTALINVIPEPSTLGAALVLGTVALASARRRSRR